MATRFLGLPVYIWADRRQVGVVEGWLTSPARGVELLVRSPGRNPLVRRVPGSSVIAAGTTGLQLDLEPERFDAGPPYVPDATLERTVRRALADGVAPLETFDGSIEVEVRDACVRMRGVATDSERRWAVERVRDVTGVLRVVDELAIHS